MVYLNKALSFFTLLSSVVTSQQQQHHGYSHGHNHISNTNNIKRQDIVPIGDTAPITTQSYVVSLKNNVKYTPSLLDQIKKVTGLSATLKEDLTGGSIFNGVVVKLGAHSDNDEVKLQITRIPDVAAVSINEEIAPPELEVESIVEKQTVDQGKGQQRLQAAVQQLYSNDQIMMQVDKLREKGITGSGIKVAVIDGEPDPNHPDLDVSYTRDFRDADDTPDADKNCGSHGLACVSLIKSKPARPGEWQGAAPGVELGSYIVYGCKKGATVDKVIKAMEQAIVDKVQIISLSLAWGDNWAFSNFASEFRIFEKLQAQGILIVIGAGNSGNQGLYRSPMSCTSPSVMCVAMAENTHNAAWYNSSGFSIDNGTTGAVRWRASVSGAVNSKEWAGVKLPLWINPAKGGWAGDGADGCAPFPANTPTDLSKYIVLLRRGDCTQESMIAAAEARGAKYVLTSDWWTGTSRLEDVRVNSPNITALAFIGGKQAGELVAAIQLGRKVTLEMGVAQRSYDSSKKNDNPEHIERQSSWGPTFDAAISVDIAAPGTEMPILVPGGKYGFAGGTSMATPMTAAAVALVAQAMGTKDMFLAASALTSTTKLMARDGGASGLASIAHQGAGMTQVERAATASAIISTRNIEFNQTNARSTKSFEIVNLKNTAITFKISNIPAGTVYSFPSDSFQPAGSFEQIRDNQYDQSATATLSFPKGTSITVPAKGKATVQVTAADPANAVASRLPIWSGWVKLETTDGFNLTVPYLGFKGDLDRSPKLHQFPIIGSSRSFVFPDEEIVVQWHVGIGSRWIETFLHHAGNKTRVNSNSVWNLGTRATGAWGAGWRGEFSGGVKVPAGQYFFRTEALRSFADRNYNWNPTKAEDYIITDSEKFTVSWK